MGKEAGADVKSFGEIEQIGRDTKDSLLAFHVLMSRISTCFWFRDFILVMELCERYPPMAHKRVLGVFRCFYQGIAALHLARDTRQAKWRRFGEEAVETMSKLAATSNWNFANKVLLLQAELHYLDGSVELAETAYKAAVESSRKHKFLHEEALSHELYGMFCIKNGRVKIGIEQLNTSRDRYAEWGAARKADQLQVFISQVSSACTVNFLDRKGDDSLLNKTWG